MQVSRLMNGRTGRKLTSCVTQNEDQMRELPNTIALQENRPFYSDSETSGEENEKGVDGIVELDEDHELLLKSCIPLLQSRNSGVSNILFLFGSRVIYILSLFLLGCSCSGPTFLSSCSCNRSAKGGQTTCSTVTESSRVAIRRTQEHCRHGS